MFIHEPVLLVLDLIELVNLETMSYYGDVPGRDWNTSTDPEPGTSFYNSSHIGFILDYIYTCLHTLLYVFLLIFFLNDSVWSTRRSIQLDINDKTIAN